METLAAAALNPRTADSVFIANERVYGEICARWLSSNAPLALQVPAYGRILPFAPHLAEYLERLLTIRRADGMFGQLSSIASDRSMPEEELVELLLGGFRLLCYDNANFAKNVRPSSLQFLLAHKSRPVRYLTVRILCLYLHAADAAMEDMIARNLGQEPIYGGWEGKRIDYRFLSLWEEKRWKHMDAQLRANSARTAVTASSGLQNPSALVADIHGVLLPRLNSSSRRGLESPLVHIPTTVHNLRCIARGLLSSSPLLLTGRAGSGKTLLIRHLASEMGYLSTMVTLHLNEQSDAKMLIGMYTAGSVPGTFVWKAGVLTTAVREGRWVVIEDLDRAPNEVISTLLPLIERGELAIPSRGETLKAARGFKIIATMRTILNSRGDEFLPKSGMLGARFWTFVPIAMPAEDEFHEIIKLRYPKLIGHASSIVRAYSRVQTTYRDPALASENGVSLRTVTPRDLLKWCDRISAILTSADTYTAEQMDAIFLEALDCFAGSLQSERARVKVMASLAEELHIDPKRRDHLLSRHEVSYELENAGSGSGQLRVGRVRLPRHRPTGPRNQASAGRTYSTNDYSLRLLERVAVAVDRREPLLLVGETGVGKTTSVQFLADQMGRKLVPFNLSQQSESADLLGGFKPVNVRSLIIPMKDEFDELFDMTFSRKKNARFVEILGKRVAKGEWKRVCQLWREALRMVDQARPKHDSNSSVEPDEDQPKKRRKVGHSARPFPEARWEKFASDLKDLESRIAAGTESFAFTFVEGNIVKAVRNGDWVLLDEINLASSDTLEAILDLLNSGPDGEPSILLTEAGNIERVVAHPDFRVFAAMNPATDVGKKDLSPGIRSRFTEIYVESPDGDAKSLRSIVQTYLGGDSRDPLLSRLCSDVTDLYMEIQRLSRANMLVDGANQKPHFSLRTLTRTLVYAREKSPLCGLRRALFEGFHMSFLTFLDNVSENLLAPIIRQYLFRKHGNVKSELSKPLRKPEDGRGYVQEGHHWLRQGKYPVQDQAHYIITPFVQRNLNNLIRAASTRKYPVLIQGPTSSGKTSMIEYLAKRSGNKFVRINNHEHTDLQEYLGTYVSGPDGQLKFQEGVFVRALREGHWVVLDELNLAPTDVLEALNRLLDDNRELLIPETQEVVRPHEDFMLFATQNPAGLYGGRKVLSRAFRNRFLELHFDDIPVEELNEILHRRTNIPESWCKRIVGVYKELSIVRQENRLFEQKSFATLRDLFRWALRKAESTQDLANNGYMLLAERVRKVEERQMVKEVIEKVMSKGGPRIIIDEHALYDANNSPEIQLYNSKHNEAHGVVWTNAMRRLYVLVAHALRNNEPVLLVGETGCGKTTVCQMLAEAFDKELNIVNAHQNTETGDLIGAQRPIRNRAAIEELLRQDLISALRDRVARIDFDADLGSLLKEYDELDEEARASVPAEVQSRIQVNRTKAAALFEWADGSLVHALKMGQFFLLDEISLADDSVLERLNSVLEPQRTMLLAEKGPVDSLVVGADGFQFMATMNPGGDYGKRELSPALRNRFTEIWVPALSDLDDILQIVRSKLKSSAVGYAPVLVSFSQWFSQKYNTSAAASISIRDTLAWVSFINQFADADPIHAIVHGAAMVFIDTLGANPAAILAINPADIDEERRHCYHQLEKLVGVDLTSFYSTDAEIEVTSSRVAVGSFELPRTAEAAGDPSSFFSARTTRLNAMRVVRALQLSKPILLEGNPGVGKTSLVTAISKAAGKRLARINLSEQTDLMDLFGSDVPVEGAQAGSFAWRDAPFLKAMKNGDWVLLDEMNLASQSVLEGLNACLDHRGEVYISELDQTFQRHPSFRLFAAQNPHHQGGGRKGLPASFVNRFTVVYAHVFTADDLTLICRQIFPSIDEEQTRRLIKFVSELDTNVMQRKFGSQGSPWEFNLRDTLRWLHLLTAQDGLLPSGTARDFLDTVFLQRFRNAHDQQCVLQLFSSIFPDARERQNCYHNLSSHTMQVGLGLLPRNALRSEQLTHGLRLSRAQLPLVETLMISIQQNWPVILVGPSGSGKSSLLRMLASAAGADLITFSMNADIDAMDLVGGYEQVDLSRQVHGFLSKLRSFVQLRLIHISSHGQAAVSFPSAEALELYERLISFSGDDLSIISPLAQQVLQNDPSGEARLLLDNLQSLLGSTRTIEGARFQWVDGILIQALEEGRWIVLDNANLCSSSVLDRLNSLLEPNGYLYINEHSNDDGSAREVKPHPNFRIFLTMDPKYGELSRAMRNRAVEISILPTQSPQEAASIEMLPSFPLEASMYRYRSVAELAESHTADLQDGLVGLALDHVSVNDIPLNHRFSEQLAEGLALTARTTTDNEETQSVLSKSVGFSPEALLPLQDRLIRSFQGLPPCGDRFLQKLMEFYSTLGSKISPVQEFARSQPLHPLNNEPLTHYNSEVQGYAAWLAAAMEYLAESRKMEEAAHTLRPQRGAQSARRQDKNKIPGFLAKSAAALSKACADLVSTGTVEPGIFNQLNGMSLLWWSFYRLESSTNFDEAAFQVYLILFQEAMTSLRASNAAGQLLTALSQELSVFNPETRLTSGLSMERIWTAFRPGTPRTAEEVRSLLRLETLADRFDKSLQRSNASLMQLSQIRQSLLRSLSLVTSNNLPSMKFILELEEAVESLEKDLVEQQPCQVYFEDAYEGLCQLLDIGVNSSRLNTQRTSQLRAELALLARRPSKSTPIAAQDSWTPDLVLKHLVNYAGVTGAGKAPLALTNAVQVSLLDKIQLLDTVQLGDLHQFKVELDLLGEELAVDSWSLVQDQVHALDQHLVVLLSHLLDAHQDFISTETDLPNDHYFGKVFDTFLKPCKTYLGSACDTLMEKVKNAAEAWTKFAIGAILLYVPNRPFDPALRPIIERQLFTEKRSSLQVKLEALRVFEQFLTGQLSNLRMRLVESEMFQMGQEPPIPAVARPDRSEMNELQGEFMNILNVLGPYLRNDLISDKSLMNKTFHANIAQIIQRLRGRYRFYDDITEPVVGLLTCFVIGLTLGSRAESLESIQRTPVTYLAAHTPFISTTRDIVVDDFNDIMTSSNAAIDIRLHALYGFAATRNLGPMGCLSLRQRETLNELFASLYSQWRERLKMDQERAAAESSLYTFRGSKEDEDAAMEKEDLELFPDYEAENAEALGLRNEKAKLQELTGKLCDIHRSIFDPDVSGKRAPEILETLLRETVQWLASAPNEEVQKVTTMESTLPAIFLTLHSKAQALEITEQHGLHYNFYYDPNLVEAKRYIALIRKIQTRFGEIQKIWPEHATLEDVLRTCSEALAFSHLEPVAKFLTKGEKLHGYMYEWQKVASREYSVAPLYDEMTSLLISWRQLELSTWARLLDLEVEKCANQTKGWWFVAYESIIAASQSLDAPSMRTHAEGLLKTLEGFFASTTLGQFYQRLRLLEQFAAHLRLLILDNPNLRPVHLALDNFLRYFTRYEKPVQEALSRGRQGLEKNMKEVIQLASWKDTNIDALKQSAKRSHQKLSKLVRKFREVLNQPVHSILSQDPAEEGLTYELARPEDVTAAADLRALQIGEQEVQSWATRPTRFKNLPATLSIMRSKATPPKDAYDGHEHINDFIGDLESTIVQLSKETPKTLTEENKGLVQHLKTRKRRLFADTLREMRQMGFQSNPGTDLLAKQGSFAVVMASLQAPDNRKLLGSSLAMAESYLHNTLGLMPQVRNVAKEHNADLTGAEVARSIGYLESLLHTMLRQRTVIAKSYNECEQLGNALLQTKDLWAPDTYEIFKAKPNGDTERSALSERVAWLAAILSVGEKVLESQAKLGNLDVSIITSTFRTWIEQLEALQNSCNSLPYLPAGITSDMHTSMEKAMRELMESVSSNILQWMKDFPFVASVLKQVLPWAQPVAEEKNPVGGQPLSHQIQALSQQIPSVLDLILGSMQDVEKANATLPCSNEDAGWLTKAEQSMSSAIKSLHMAQVASALNSILNQIRYLPGDERNSLRVVAALLASVRPILDQYAAIARHTILRYLGLHYAICKMTYRLSKVFIQIGTHGFCTPAEQSDEKMGKDDKLEGGTGLGEGEGAEDISKDIQDDEDLSDLAQQPDNKDNKDEIEDEKDAVDMADEDMEGQLDDEAEQEDEGQNGDEEDDIEEEMGDVDDLGPSTVDEKMWDDGQQDAEKDKEGDESKGTTNNEEQVAKQDKEGDREEGQDQEQEEDMDAEAGVDESEEVGQEEMEQTDPHLQEEQTLDLPEDLDMGGDEGKEDDDILGSDDDTLGELEPEETEQQDENAEVEDGSESPAPADPDAIPEDENAAESVDQDLQEVDDHPDEEQDQQNEQDEQAVDEDLTTADRKPDEDEKGADEAAEAGTGIEAQEDAQHDQDNSTSAVQQDQGTQGEAAEQDNTAGEKGTKQAPQQEAAGRDEDLQDAPEANPFKKLGDTLEKWYQQQRQIQESAEKDESQARETIKDVDMADADFEHLPDEHTEHDTQALGTATEEQAKALDEDMALPSNELPEHPLEDVMDTAEEELKEDQAMQDVEPTQQERKQEESGQSAAFVGQPRDFNYDDENGGIADEEQESDSEVSEVDHRLEATHIDGSLVDAPRDVESARALWTRHESSTRTLSQSLTEQLRLILAPTSATKLRGDFRTGKRLNLKRIIPYIASSYKRDKIWLRRSLPSKRAYQIMIAVDDSKSMAESRSSELAFETLALVAKALAMLESGELCVVGFGSEVRVAHSFDKPFTSDSGVDVFRQFGFQQDKTDVRNLVQQSIKIFQEARMRATGAGAELWQLQLIVSDGICDSHEEIQRLVRQAQEQRIMLVFVIVDPAALRAESESEGQSKQSILDMQSVDFTPEGKVVRWRYMDRFPFRWYLVVRDVKELPGVLATALRQWFAEVADSSAA